MTHNERLDYYTREAKLKPQKDVEFIPSNMTQGEILQYYRKEAGITQREMAQLTGLTKNHISDVERNKHKLNSNALLIYIKTCNIPLEVLY